MSSHNHNNVVAMWQTILWADGYLYWSDIDCWFGQDTWNATKRWKLQYPNEGLGDNGEAGHGAFRVAAEERLFPGGHGPDGSMHLFYSGKAGRTINFWRGSDNIYTMSLSGDVHRLAYGYANFDKCT
jgi:hypothetical protein